MLGSNPAELSLKDWLDAGYVMVTRDASPEARTLLDALFDSETEEDVEIGFDDLAALAEWYDSQARKAMEGREKPPVSRRAGSSPQSELEAWTEFVEAHREPDPE